MKKFHLLILTFIAALFVGNTNAYADTALTQEETPYVSEFPEVIGDIDDEDWYWLAHLLAGECQTYSWDHQIAVGSVVLNRVADPSYPDTIDGVITDKHYGTQYACYYDGNFFRDPTERNWLVAEYLLKYGSQLPETVVYQAQFKQGSGVWQKIDRHYFCYK